PEISTRVSNSLDHTPKSRITPFFPTKTSVSHYVSWIPPSGPVKYLCFFLVTNSSGAATGSAELSPYSQREEVAAAETKQERGGLGDFDALAVEWQVDQPLAADAAELDAG